MISRDNFLFHIKTIKEQSEWVEYYKDEPSLSIGPKLLIENSVNVLTDFYDEVVKQDK